MIKNPKRICLLGNGINILCLGYVLEKLQVPTRIILLNNKCNILNSYVHNSNIFEQGILYSFSMRHKNEKKENTLFTSLLRNVNMESEVLECNKYAQNISYLDEYGCKYRINKYIFRILLCLFKDYFLNKPIHIDQNENLKGFLMKYFDTTICQSLILPYCHHYFGINLENILINSCFPDFTKKVKNKRSLVQLLLKRNDEESFFSKGNKIFTFKEGNAQLNKKLIEYLQHSPNVEITKNASNVFTKVKNKRIEIWEGRKKINYKEIVLCMNPLELKHFLRKHKIDKNMKYKLRNYVQTFRQFHINIINVGFTKRVLPLSELLESLLLIKKKEETNKIISVLYDSNIFPEKKKEGFSKGEIKLKLRFLNEETNKYKAIKDTLHFIKKYLKIKESPNIVLSNECTIFPYIEKKEKCIKKLMNRTFKNAHIFWDFSFSKNFEYCLQKAESFSKNIYHKKY